MEFAQKTSRGPDSSVLSLLSFPSLLCQNILSDFADSWIMPATSRRLFPWSIFVTPHQLLRAVPAWMV